jgi:hypothetical protein
MPGLALQCLLDRERPGVEVNTVPRQAERFTLPQPEGKRDRPASRAALELSRLEDPPRLRGGQRLHFGSLQRRGIHERAHVAGDASTLNGDLQCPRQDPVRGLLGGLEYAVGIGGGSSASSSQAPGAVNLTINTHVAGKHVATVIYPDLLSAAQQYKNRNGYSGLS